MEKFVLAGLGVVLAAAILISLSGEGMTFGEGVYRVFVPRLEGLNEDFSNLRVDGADFWVEGVEKEGAWVWMKVVGRRKVVFGKGSAKQSPEKIFTFFDDFQSFDRGKWGVVNLLPSLPKMEEMPKKRGCFDIGVKDGVLTIKGGKSAVHCRIVSRGKLGKVVMIRFKGSGDFEVGFEDGTGREVVLKGFGGSWRLEERVGDLPKMRSLSSKEVKPSSGWVTLRLLEGQVEIGDESLEVKNFRPMFVFMRSGFLGRLEVDWVLSVEGFEEVEIGR